MRGSRGEKSGLEAGGWRLEVEGWRLEVGGELCCWWWWWWLAVEGVFWWARGDKEVVEVPCCTGEVSGYVEGG